MSKTPKITADYENLGIIRLSFEPAIELWRFPNGNRDKLIAAMYESVTKQFVYQPLDSRLMLAIESYAQQIVYEWIQLGEVLIPEPLKLDMDPWESK